MSFHFSCPVKLPTLITSFCKSHLRIYGGEIWVGLSWVRCVPLTVNADHKIQGLTCVAEFQTYEVR